MKIKKEIDFTKKEICWTTTPYSTRALNQLPYVLMWGYQQTWSDLSTAISKWMTRFTNAASAKSIDVLIGKGNPYEGLYHGNLVTKYKLPYFNEYHHNITQSWQENQGPAGETIKKITGLIEAAGKAVLPAAGILFPKSYAGSTAASYTIGLTLINTYGGLNVNTNIENNRSFINSIINYNLHQQNCSLSVEPPLIYEILIPGVRWSPAAVIAGLTVNNKGTLNFINDRITPDAWEVQISIQELINESRLIYNESDNLKIDNVTVRSISTGS